MSRAYRQLCAGLQRLGVIRPNPSADYYAPEELVDLAHARGRARGMSTDLVRACVRIAIVRAERVGRRVTLEDVVEVFDERVTGASGPDRFDLVEPHYE